jgi:altronate dehydratase
MMAKVACQEVDASCGRRALQLNSLSDQAMHMHSMETSTMYESAQSRRESSMEAHPQPGNNTG